MSYVEFFGVVFGLIAVWLTARAIIWGWVIGILNIVFAFILYYQIQLYPDMFLQVFFFVTNLLGWWRWAHPKPEEEDNKKELRVSLMKRNQTLLIVLIAVIFTFLTGRFAANLHRWFPDVFALPSAYPYVDSFILVMSIVATFLAIQKKIECWVVWIVVDITATILYYKKEIRFYSFEYLIFTMIALFGLWKWITEYRGYQQDNVDV